MNEPAKNKTLIHVDVNVVLKSEMNGFLQISGSRIKRWETIDFTIYAIYDRFTYSFAFLRPKQ